MICTKCKVDKDVSAFHKRSERASGYRSHCKECRAEEQRSRYLSKPYNTARCRSSLLRKYGITREQYEDMYEQQEGCCAICSQHESTFTRALAVDHCHQTGKVRGLLCVNCNVGLGNFKDSEEFLTAAIAYLKE